MGLFDKNKKVVGIMDEIRCDKSSYLIWKWHSPGTASGEYARENAIRWGSSLRVKDGEMAVFVYKQKDDTLQDYIIGPYDGIINTDNFPVLASIIGLAYGGGTPFQADIYYINLAQIIQVKFAVPFFDIYDPRFEDFGVPTAVRGTMSFKITDYKAFIKLHRLNDFNLTDFQQQIKDAVTRYVKDIVANAPAANNIPLIQIETKISQINDVAELYVSERLKEDFGVTVSGLDIGAIEIDKSSDGYSQLMTVTKDIVSTKIKAQTLDYTERLRIQREVDQYALNKQIQTNNLAAFKIEKQAEVGIAGANALGDMVSQNEGNINLSENSNSGFNMATMMTSMAVGSAVGQNIVSSINNMMNNEDYIVDTPPSIPTSSYYVAINEHPEGPFNISILTKMVNSGQITRDSLVWKKGMKEWEKIGDVFELQDLFVTIPSIPTNK